MDVTLVDEIPEEFEHRVRLRLEDEFGCFERTAHLPDDEFRERVVAEVVRTRFGGSRDDYMERNRMLVVPPMLLAARDVEMHHNRVDFVYESLDCYQEIFDNGGTRMICIVFRESDASACVLARMTFQRPDHPFPVGGDITRIVNYGEMIQVMWKFYLQFVERMGKMFEVDAGGFSAMG